jgi:hypothetical protein
VTGVLLRRRRWVAALLAALVGLLNRDSPLDLPAFADLGRSVLAGQFDRAYAGTFTQAGPLELVLSRVLVIGGHQGIPSPAPRILVDVALTLGAMAAARGRPVREVAVAALALLWLLGPVPWSGHPVEVAVPVLWAYAMSARNRWPALALAVLIAPLAVLGFPGLLAVDGPSRAARNALLALALAAPGYLPFVLSGQFGMFGHVWPAAAGTLPWLLGRHEVTWVARLGQAVVVAGGCGLVAYLLRGRLVAVAAAPLAAALLRVATDPLRFDHYWVPVGVGAVLLVALLPDERSIWPFVVVGYVTMIAAMTDRAAAGALVCLLGYVAISRPPVRRAGVDDPAPMTLRR